MSNLIDKQDMINTIDEYKKELCEIYDGKEWSEDDGFCHVGKRREDDF